MEVSKDKNGATTRFAQGEVGTGLQVGSKARNVLSQSEGVVLQFGQKIGGTINANDGQSGSSGGQRMPTATARDIDHGTQAAGVPKIIDLREKKR